MKRVSLTLSIISASVLCAATGMTRDRARPSSLASVIGDRPAAARVECIDPRQIDSTQIIDGSAIVYGIGGRLYVNRPSAGAATLRSDDVIVSTVYGGELCRIDTVTLVDPVTRTQRGFVILAAFDVYGRRP